MFGASTPVAKNKQARSLLILNNQFSAALEPALLVRIGNEVSVNDIIDEANDPARRAEHITT